MRLPASSIKNQAAARALNPSERVSQRGVASSKQLLEALIAGLAAKDGDKLAIIQIEPGEFGEFGHASLSMMLESSVPYIAYKGIYIKKGVNDLSEGSASLGDPFLHNHGR